MKYLLANVFDEPILSYHRDLVDKIVVQFPQLTLTKERGLPAHITLKYPFEADNIAEIEAILQRFAASHSKTAVDVGGYDHFDDRVVFLKVDASPEMRANFAELTAEFKKMPWMTWDRGDGDHFHVTLAENCNGAHGEVMEYIKPGEKHFRSAWDNITIFKRIGETPNRIGQWEVHKTYPLGQ